MDNLDLFGQYGDDGKLIKDAPACILSGRAIEQGDPTFGIGKYFYRVSCSALAQHTPEVRETLKAIIEKPTKKPVKADKETEL